MGPNINTAQNKYSRNEYGTKQGSRVGIIAIASLISAIATTIANSDSGSGYRFLDK